MRVLRISIPSGAPVLALRRRNVAVRSVEKGAGLSEDMMERLKKAEEEAAALREQLKSLQAQGPEGAEPVEQASKRIDGSDLKRVVPWEDSGNLTKNWVSESDVVGAITGGGPSEMEATAGVTPEEQAVVNRRLIMGGVFTVGFGALALIPDGFFAPKPSKPMFFYLAPLVRAQQVLGGLQEPISEARWSEVQDAVRSILPTARQNLDSVAALLDDRAKYDRAKALATEFLEFLEAVDYQKYFDTLEKAPPKGGKREADFVRFSSEANKQALDRLASFLALAPADQIEAARAQVQARAF